MGASAAFPHRAASPASTLRHPQRGQYGSPPLSAQRMRWNVARASSSVMRATDAKGERPCGWGKKEVLGQ